MNTTRIRARLFDSSNYPVLHRASNAYIVRLYKLNNRRNINSNARNKNLIKNDAEFRFNFWATASLPLIHGIPTIPHGAMLNLRHISSVLAESIWYLYSNLEANLFQVRSGISSWQ